MKSSRIFSLILLFFFTVSMFGLSFAQKAPDPKPGEPERHYTTGKTSVSDLSLEQKRKRLGLVIPDWYQEWWEHAEKLKAPEGAKFDPVFDWREHIGPYGTNGVTPAKDQDSCGACWAFAALGALESMVKIYGEMEMDLSEQQILSCNTHGGGCDGGWMTDAYYLFRDVGSVDEVCMPYHINDTDPCIQNQCEKWAKIDTWSAVGITVNDIKNAILTGPVAVTVRVDDDAPFFWYNDGCYNTPSSGGLPNHAVLLVGWDDTMCDGNGAWIGKNSWGKSWGIHGFFYIEYGCCQIGRNGHLIHYIFHRPFVRIEDYGVNDQAGGDGDGRAEPGETIRLDFALKNVWSPLWGVGVTVTADTEGIVITDDYSDLGDMDSKEILDNSSDPMEFYVPDDFPPKRVLFTFEVTGDSGYSGGPTYTTDTTVEVFVCPDILLIDDDQGVDSLGTNYEDYFIDAFDSLKAVYDMWDKKAYPDTTYDFSEFDILIWFTGDHRDSVFSDADIESLMTFLDNGGRLFLTSQDAVEVLSISSDSLDTLFLKNYLHVGYDGNNTKHLVAGQPGDEVGDTLWIRPEQYPGADNQTSKDNLVPDSEADTVLVYANSGFTPTDLVAGAKFLNDFFKVVVFGFGFEAINSSGDQFHGKWLSKPHSVMQRVLDWLKAPGPTINVLSPNGGETYYAEDTCDILWESSSFEDSVKIEICCIDDGDTTCSTIVDTTTSDGVYSWAVPDTPSDSCLIIISDVENGIPSDTSDDYFSISNYLPGDADGNGTVDLGDILFLISYLYKGGPAPIPLAAGDPNGDCVLDLGDVLYLISYLYKGGPAPQPGCAY